MPWLVKDRQNPKDNLLFIHVPRCGGTSLSKLFQTEIKSRQAFYSHGQQSRDPYHWLGMIYFFYRYKRMESANFPWKTWENLIAAIQIITSIILWTTTTDSKCRTRKPNGECGPVIAAYTLLASGLLMFLSSTFLFSAPFLLRNTYIRRMYGIFVGRIMFNFIACEEYLTGTNHKGFLVHFTAAKMLKYEFINENDLDEADSFAIVRNPYSRMVSIYMYNRFGPAESFKNFTRTWIEKKMKIYKETGSTEEWDIYCHALPQYEYTHCQGKQIIKSIIRQEELKTLWKGEADKWSERHRKRLKEIPEKVAKAMQEMPHSNQRKRDKPWWDYYDQETQDLVAQAFAIDFHVYGYSPEMPRRPDLVPPVLTSQDIEHFSSNIDFSDVFDDGNIEKLAKQKSNPIAELGSLVETYSLNGIQRLASDVESQQGKITLLKTLAPEDIEQAELEEESSMVISDLERNVGFVAGSSGFSSVFEPPQNVYVVRGAKDVPRSQIH